MPSITDKFVAKYAKRQAPWGFNGLGEVVFLRTYSRPREDLGRSETWPETLQRAINGSIEIGADYTQEEAERLFDHMFHLRGTFAGRALWQLGTPLVQKFSGTSLVNCLAYETEILTSEGVQQIGDLAGTTALLMDGHGKWVDSEVKSFGQQSLLKVTLSRGGKSQKIVFATPEHRWFAYGSSSNDEAKCEVLTRNLTPGQDLICIRGQGVTGTVRPSAFGIAAGIVFGDGNLVGVSGSSGSGVTLCGQKDQELVKWFPNSPTSEIYQGDKWVGTRVRDLPKAFKDRPSLQESKSYLYGWLAGYFAADGCVRKTGQVELASASRENLEFVRDVCYRLGVLTHPIYHQDRIGIDGVESRLYSLGFGTETLSEEFFLIQNHRERFVAREHNPRRFQRAWRVVSVEETDRVEEVFCAVVPTTHSFVLADNLLTGNCWFVNIESIEDFEFLFDHLMLGGGVGFSVERAKIHDLPKVKAAVKITHERTNDADIIVPDSRNGWSRLLHSVLKSYFYTGKSFTYSTLLVRSYGAPIKTFGGTASGPEALIEGISDICSVLNARVGKKLRSTDVLDIGNIIGRMVVAGGSRRSSQIAIGDPDDIPFMGAKNWGKGDIPAWRGNSNNSIFADDWDEIQPQVWKNYDGSGEPYGLLNRKLARAEGRLGERSPDTTIEGFNPCAEIGLAHREPCNLATIFLPNVETYEQFLDLSQLLYKCQKAITGLDYPYEETNKVTRKNRRIGQNVSGLLQATPEQIGWLAPSYEALRTFDDKYSEEAGIPSSVRLTTVQPSGTLSLLAGVTPGIHPSVARHYIRRVRFGSVDPLIDACRKKGYKVVPEIGLDGREDHTRWVVEFPCEAPESATLASELSAVQQLEWVKKIQGEWADNAISVTVYYSKEELPDIKAWLEQNYEHSIKSVSFLLRVEHGFALAPYEEISKEQYDELVARVKADVPFQNVLGSEDMSLDDCDSGACPVR